MVRSRNSWVFALLFLELLLSFVSMVGNFYFAFCFFFIFERILLDGVTTVNIGLANWHSLKKNNKEVTEKYLMVTLHHFDNVNPLLAFRCGFHWLCVAWHGLVRGMNDWKGSFAFNSTKDESIFWSDLHTNEKLQHFVRRQSSEVGANNNQWSAHNLMDNTKIKY